MDPKLLILLQVGGIIGVFYFLVVRPSSLAKKQTDAMQRGLKKGDEVVTAGGIVGKVRDVKEHLVTIESGGSTLVIERQRIVRTASTPAPGGS